jgi:uncharacterized protein
MNGIARFLGQRDGVSRPIHRSQSSSLAAAPGKSPGGYLFLPKLLARGRVLKYLRRTHAWLGLWGAALGLLFGATGILLNHRELLKIPLPRMEQKEAQLALPDPRPADPKALAQWLGLSLGFDAAHARIIQEPAKDVIWNGVAIRQPARWQVSVRSPQRFIQADYWQGNGFLSLKSGEASVFALLTNLHKGVGLGVGWILLADSLAGGLMLLSLTGVLLWSGLHGRRLLAAGLGFGSAGLGLWFAVQAMI